ncbi:SOS response-associated peptidase [Mangrovicoccus sp. HB161399]|uniref:SOS response-associated peptidase n=1 Tax=Mangrovicoccus sp. HB161399 TaxID=2720392 RepID=UPI001551771A|nr:SOS response-associated peptidase [Mangrovicoccus sp. HB161399]
MCGRFALTLPPEAMVQLFGAAPANDLPELPNWNICPTNAVHAVLSQEGTRRFVSLRWGFIPVWYKSPGDGPLLINARAETIAEKPAFRQAARARRCLVPASGFYEWTKDGDGKRLPWYIHPEGQEFVAFAGVWQDWTSADGLALSTCAIVTTEANEALGHIHHRMPVTVAEPDWGLWLGEAGHGAAVLMRPAPEDLFAAYRVDPRVNSNRAEGPELIEPFDG